jgi:hypothetical protein
VSQNWQFTLNETSVHFLLAIKARDRQKLIHALEALAAEPLQRGDFEGKDDTGRSIQIKVAGSFLISFWPDLFVRELRIINIEWI